jgi:pyroglutamyl-peptidase
MKTLLITGFDAFNAQSVNPSWEAVKRLPDQIGNYTLHKLQLPTLYSKAPEFLLRSAAELQPDVILCIGQAGGRDAVTPERIAVNIRDAKIADNAGVFHDGQRIAPKGDAAYFATVPVEAMAQAIRNCSIPAAVSNTAGTFVCNDVLYSMLHRYRGTAVRCGFIHVPYMPEQGTPNMPLETTVRALTAAIIALDT